MSPLAYFKAGVGVLLLGLLIWGLSNWHEAIQESGRAEVQVLWDADKAAHAAEVQKLKDEYAAKEETHRAENRRISSEISQANLDHANALAAVRLDYAERLRTSEARLAIYQRQSQGGAAERGDLADHAGRLDASLEEGRSLVRELRTTLGLRDRQVAALSQQLLNDRALIAEQGKK